MELQRLSTLEKVVGALGMALIVVLFIPWFQIDAVIGDSASASGWKTSGPVALVILLFAGAVVGLLAAKATGREIKPPVPLGLALIIGGIVIAILALLLINSPPESVSTLEATSSPSDEGLLGGIIADDSLTVSTGNGDPSPLGVVIAALLGAALAVAGFRLLRAEGTSAKAEALALRDRIGGGEKPAPVGAASAATPAAAATGRAATTGFMTKLNMTRLLAGCALGIAIAAFLPWATIPDGSVSGLEVWVGKLTLVLAIGLGAYAAQGLRGDGHIRHHVWAAIGIGLILMFALLADSVIEATYNVIHTGAGLTATILLAALAIWPLTVLWRDARRSAPVVP